jgi:8-oxo-dGTP pyrophosphatase MutT (NUDIX family)
MGSSRVGINNSQGRNYQLSTKFVRLAELRKLKECAQVAAVCYRVRGGAIEFLLVRTGKGRWIFPKGSVEPGLTHAQAAALEAFEEAGVHGRMEEASFTSYLRRGRRQMRSSRGRSSGKDGAVESGKEPAVSAHLCEVLRLVPPQELDRDPTWFSAAKARRCLREDRTADFGAELARVVDSAVSRIKRLRTRGVVAVPDPRKVQFIDIGRVRQAAKIKAKVWRMA